MEPPEDPFYIEFILARERVPCPDCDYRGDLASYPDTTSGKPLKVWKRGLVRVKNCSRCKGHAWVKRGSVA